MDDKLPSFELCSAGIAGENLSAFEMLELMACCNKTTRGAIDDCLWAELADQLPTLAPDPVVINHTIAHQ